VAVYVVSDLHSAVDELRAALPEGATLLLLGDLINFIDYYSLTGILTEVFSVETVSRIIELRTAGRLQEASEVMQLRSEGREEEIRSEIGRLVVEQYARVFSALPDPSYLIMGNVDNPATARRVAGKRPALNWADGRVVTIDGERFGFVGGALPTPLHVAGEISEEEMRAKIDGLGDCDVICSHIPPAVPELCYDTVARKSERGSKDLLDYIRRVQPRFAYFGHIHQPLVSALHVGRTLCLNVGYFRATRRAWLHPANPPPEPEGMEVSVWQMP
jgi:Icc-related predicted phosphoesterase